MNGQPLTWREHADERWTSWTAADPLSVDDEPLAWQCPDCGETMARDAIADHRAAHAMDPARGTTLGIVLGLACWAALIVAVVWAVRR